MGCSCAVCGVGRDDVLRTTESPNLTWAVMAGHAAASHRFTLASHNNMTLHMPKPTTLSVLTSLQNQTNHIIPLRDSTSRHTDQHTTETRPNTTKGPSAEGTAEVRQLVQTKKTVWESQWLVPAGIL